MQTFVYILNNIQVYEEPVKRTKKIPQCAVKFEAGKDTKKIYMKVCTVLKIITLLLNPEPLLINSIKRQPYNLLYNF